MATDVPIPKLPDTKKLEFLAFMIWVALIGAVLILLIDYQIKAAILKASDKAWRGLDAIKTEQRGFGNTANTGRDNPAGILYNDGPEMETRIVVTGVVDPTSEMGPGNAANGTAPKRSTRARNSRVPPKDKQVEP